MTTLAVQFQDYANSLGNGYLKIGKAVGIICTLTNMKTILNDEVRFLKYVKNCLEMEGFKPTDCELIMGWFYERLA